MEPPKILHTDFYNEILDNVDLLQEYKNWQNPEYQGGFSFCQYPFLITISGKRTILQKDSETQMIQQAEVRYSDFLMHAELINDYFFDGMFRFWCNVSCNYISGNSTFRKPSKQLYSKGKKLIWTICF